LTAHYTIDEIKALRDALPQKYAVSETVNLPPFPYKVIVDGTSAAIAFCLTKREAESIAAFPACALNRREDMVWILLVVAFISLWIGAILLRVLLRTRLLPVKKYGMAYRDGKYTHTESIKYIVMRGRPK
jgi:hypothetical protein